MHFGRAAPRLGIAQPPLSRAIQQLERRLGAVLLDRTSRTVRLTEAGSVLLVEGRAARDAVDAAERGCLIHNTEPPRPGGSSV
ncbi:LysR family transcriptional regulator, partial [Streptomyces sp. NPDC059744]|uniref:LysR family transcriptional regulator n=1 Tax=Streptomyces sp. NPDC059744 TaxID=3346929 RepID=UPI0036655D82